MTDNKTIKLSVAALVFISLSLLFIGTFNTALSMERSDIPLVNDAWASALQAIHDDSESNPGKPWEKGIITSWWDFGHHFKYLSDRAVTFDGGTQVTPQAHWVGKLFLSSDESESVGILRMLDCGGNNAFDEVNKKLKDAPKTIDWLNKQLNAGTGIVTSPTFTFGDVELESKYLYCTPTSGYVIASEDMIGKAGVWGHFGLWDFNRADIWINVKKMPREQAISYMLTHNYVKTDNEAQQIWAQAQTMTEPQANNWLAPWPGYAGVYDCNKQNDSLACANGAVIQNNEIQNGVTPQSFVYVDDEKIIEKKFSNATLGYSMILTPDNKLVLSSPELANSLFTKLFFLNGTGLKNFQLLTKTQNIDGFKIYVYKVKW